MIPNYVSIFRKVNSVGGEGCKLLRLKLRKQIPTELTLSPELTSFQYGGHNAILEGAIRHQRKGNFLVTYYSFEKTVCLMVTVA